MENIPGEPRPKARWWLAPAEGCQLSLALAFGCLAARCAAAMISSAIFDGFIRGEIHRNFNPAFCFG